MVMPNRIFTTLVINFILSHFHIYNLKVINFHGYKNNSSQLYMYLLFFQIPLKIISQMDTQNNNK